MHASTDTPSGLALATGYHSLTESRVPIKRRWNTVGCIAAGRAYERFGMMIARMARALRPKKPSLGEGRVGWIPLTRPSQQREHLEHR